MSDDADKRKRRHIARQPQLPIVTFDDALDAELRSRGIETENDTDGHLEVVREEHELTLFEYMVDNHLIIPEE